MIPTPFLCSSAPVYIIVYLTLVILPFSAHLTSDSPNMSMFILFISCTALSSFPDWSKVLTFHVAIFKISPLVFSTTSSNNFFPVGFGWPSSFAALLAGWLLTSSLSFVSGRVAGGQLVLLCLFLIYLLNP